MRPSVSFLWLYPTNSDKTWNWCKDCQPYTFIWRKVIFAILISTHVYKNSMKIVLGCISVGLAIKYHLNNRRSLNAKKSPTWALGITPAYLSKNAINVSLLQIHVGLPQFLWLDSGHSVSDKFDERVSRHFCSQVTNNWMSSFFLRNCDAKW